MTGNCNGTTHGGDGDDDDGEAGVGGGGWERRRKGGTRTIFGVYNACKRRKQARECIWR